jgi:hypothetical protein
MNVVVGAALLPLARRDEESGRERYRWVRWVRLSGCWKGGQLRELSLHCPRQGRENAALFSQLVRQALRDDVCARLPGVSNASTMLSWSSRNWLSGENRASCVSVSGGIDATTLRGMSTMRERGIGGSPNAPESSVSRTSPAASNNGRGL